jgi:hypothetical protein
MRKLIALIMLVLTAIPLAGAARDASKTVSGTTAFDGAVPRAVLPTSSLRYGPFTVIDDDIAMLNGPTDSVSPSDFQRMVSDFPHLRVLRMANCPGTSDDVANLRLGRMIRAQGMATTVPASGSIRSGAVELFIAGVGRTVSDGAEFAVHSWIDQNGREAQRLASNDPVNQTYLAYYRDMGLSAEQARAFYALTNSVPHDRALWLGRTDIARYISLRKASQV